MLVLVKHSRQKHCTTYNYILFPGFGVHILYYSEVKRSIFCRHHGNFKEKSLHFEISKIPPADSKYPCKNKQQPVQGDFHRRTPLFCATFAIVLQQSWMQFGRKLSWQKTRIYKVQRSVFGCISYLRSDGSSLERLFAIKVPFAMAFRFFSR